MTRLEREKQDRLLTVIADTRNWMLSHHAVKEEAHFTYIVARLTAALLDHGITMEDDHAGQ